MENFNRDKFAKELNDARDLGEKGKKLAQGLKAEVNKTEEYKKAKELHIQENKDDRDPNSQRSIHARADSLRGEIKNLKEEKRVEEESLKKEEKIRIEQEKFKNGLVIEDVKTDDIIRVIEEYNKNLEPGETKWRMLTSKDVGIVLMPLTPLFNELRVVTSEMGSLDSKKSEESKKRYDFLSGEEERISHEIKGLYSDRVKSFGLDPMKSYWVDSKEVEYFPYSHLKPEGGVGRQMAYGETKKVYCWFVKYRMRV
jgi:hypothetical protein